MSETISLAEARAGKLKDATLWTVADALRAALREIETGQIKPDMVYIALRENDGKGISSYDFMTAGSNSRLEVIGLLAEHMHGRSAQ